MRRMVGTGWMTLFTKTVPRLVQTILRSTHYYTGPARGLLFWGLSPQLLTWVVKKSTCFHRKHSFCRKKNQIVLHFLLSDGKAYELISI